MKHKYVSLATITAALLLFTGCGRSNSDMDKGAPGDASVQSSGTASSTADKDVDNTGVNKRDRNDGTLTSGDQSGSKADREITRKIRREIVKNKDLSTSAKNIKIITKDGKVTLRGPVKSEDEKNAILTAAKTAAGDAQVDNQLEVKQTTEKTDK